MRKSATEVMQDIVAAAVLDAIAALKAASKGLPNNLLRDLNAIHANTTFADLPAEVQNAVSASVRAAFSQAPEGGLFGLGRRARGAASAAPGRPACRRPAPAVPPPAAQTRRRRSRPAPGQRRRPPAAQAAAALKPCRLRR